MGTERVWNIARTMEEIRINGADQYHNQEARRRVENRRSRRPRRARAVCMPSQPDRVLCHGGKNLEDEQCYKFLSFTSVESRIERDFFHLHLLNHEWRVEIDCYSTYEQ
jgi:hypothetical protein